MIHENKLTLTRRLMMGTMIAGLCAPGMALAQGAKPKIGFIGAGRLGGTLAKLWTEAGYQVMLSARDLGPVKELASQLGPNAQVGTPDQAAAWGDVVVVSVPYAALPQVGHDYAAQLKGKVIIDTCNPNPARDGDMTKDAIEKGTGVMDPIYLPGTQDCARLQFHQLYGAGPGRPSSGRTLSASNWRPTIPRRWPSPSSWSPMPAMSRWWWAIFPPPRNSMPARRSIPRRCWPAICARRWA